MVGDHARISGSAAAMILRLVPRNRRPWLAGERIVGADLAEVEASVIALERATAAWQIDALELGAVEPGADLRFEEGQASARRPAVGDLSQAGALVHGPRRAASSAATSSSMNGEVLTGHLLTVGFLPCRAQKRCNPADA